MRFGNSSDYFGLRSNTENAGSRTPLLARVLTRSLNEPPARSQLECHASDFPSRPTVQLPSVPRSPVRAAVRLRGFKQEIRAICTLRPADQATNALGPSY